tara:strand:- start:76 stop:861 length:786 start_codon:yes stop_codon:yes gene_type:complete
MLNVHEIRSSKLKKTVRGIFNFLGLEIRRKNSWYEKYRDSVVEIDKNLEKILERSENYINASLPNRWGIIQSLQHVKRNRIKGDIVETGVFHGGGIIFLNDILNYLKLKKTIWGYDTFEGIPSINLKKDRILGSKKNKQVEKKDNMDKNIYPTLVTVKNNLKKNNVKNQINLIEGDTKKTLKIKKHLPKKISFLRLDTDFYESTLNELETLYPKISKNGILMIDDYGHHVGCRKAVDEYFRNKKIWLHRIDYTARLIIKKD